MLPGFCVSFPVFAFGLAVLNVAGCQTMFWLAASINSGDRWKTRVGLGCQELHVRFSVCWRSKVHLQKTTLLCVFVSPAFLVISHPCLIISVTGGSSQQPRKSKD